LRLASSTEKGDSRAQMPVEARSPIIMSSDVPSLVGEVGLRSLSPLTVGLRIPSVVTCAIILAGSNRDTKLAIRTFGALLALLVSCIVVCAIYAYIHRPHCFRALSHYNRVCYIMWGGFCARSARRFFYGHFFHPLATQIFRASGHPWDTPPAQIFRPDGRNFIVAPVVSPP
jgi:hypothetical protein